MTEELDYTVERGDTLTIPLEFQVDDITPQSIVGWTIFFTLKKNKNDTDAQAIISKDVTSHLDPTNGITSITVTATETNTLLGPYYYDIQYKDADANIITIIKGTITFIVDITRRIT